MQFLDYKFGLKGSTYTRENMICNLSKNDRNGYSETQISRISVGA